MASTSVGSNAIVLELLNQHNYKDWSSQVETYLLAKELWDVVKQPPPNAGDVGYKAWKAKDARALHAIKISCGTEMFSFIRASKTAKDAWNVLEKKCNWDENILKSFPDTGCTDLHKAAMNGEVDTVKELLSSMRDEDVKIKDGKGRTALDGVIVASSAKAQARSIQIARAMVEKNREIVEISSWPWKYIPVVRACSRNKWEMARYLFSLTPDVALLSENGRQGAQLISMCIWRPKGLDVAWKVLQQYPKLAMADNGFGQHPMLELAGINHIYEMKLNHLRFDKFLSCMAEKVMKDLDKLTEDEFQVVRTSLFKAIAQGHVEFVMHMFEANRAVMNIFDDKKKSMFQYAIECRQEKIYNLIYRLKPEEMDDITHNIATFKTNMLHSAANLPSVKHSDHIQGASLQMQRELQWFKEVERMLPREMHEYVNISNVTARELFTRNHKILKDEAEISTKGIATSCTTVGALIVTIMFAAAFTVPGGTKSTNSDNKTLVRVFILSDTISLISSATSVITFLGLLTSTYAEDDFLRSLPTKMMIGLSTLFISIATMMITFSCALIIMFDGEAKMIITGIVLAGVPVVSFVFFLFPLLFEICVATYGPSMFH
ncbi:ankyrin repeat-containing protein NPR4-like [Argentina anserina]|uniref:ankyrin repeat-containing protein NPR4-like n=1 Tax=Argentina anserina TaxID=57926 RepID=UPI002176857F|nr:ankyrin repeat-containing protein NPR4-like [Potentilla anserina]